MRIHRKFVRIIVYIFLPGICLCANAQEETKWDYPIKPGTEEWNNLTTEKARISALQIPENIITKMSTENLIDACINFPLFGYYSAFSTPQEGFNIMFSRFNIFNKICKKDSIGQYLVKIYEDAEMNGWRQMAYKFDNKYWTLKLTYLEYLIAQKEVISKLNQKDKVKLLKIAKTKFAQKGAHQSFNSIPGISPTLLLICRILYSDKVLDDSILSNENFKRFLETGLLTDTEIIDEILNSAEIYLNE